ncbi:alpha/beta fold hydrolase [Streptomyces sp. VRA16 Mangrove soil]|uniref:alpha/beta fold hydrolase n=1 Tax=Streptomyces sp. VRA16 Mangrove soil TaxID=2817434 RepID=UPI001A9DC06B|nr:alpha/beta hydrolase [Streptomyces sp. VRA16 Mangrove soil]MBO1330449.1 alpha/beta hydrolase [Streptomyces sp. VRA16 Mangrove soil]
MTEFVELEGGRIACDVVGEGPLVVLSHGMGTWRADFRHLVPVLVDAGYRVVNADMRGHGESSTGWASVTGKRAISRTDVAGDLLGVVRHFGGPATIVGHSLSGGAATIAAALAPELVTTIVEINPFTRVTKIDVGALLTVRRYRRGGLRLIGTQLLKSHGLWRSYLDVAYPGKPDDYRRQIDDLMTALRRPGRWQEFMKTGRTTPADAGARLPEVRCPALVIMGDQDPDFPDPVAEGEAIVAAMPAGLGQVAVIEDGGHYPHAQSSDRVAELVIAFLREHTRDAVRHTT